MTIEGYGRFQEPTRIEFAPVTFLIGPNGAGKSTVGRVLAILREAFHGGSHAGMEQGEEFKVWFEFANVIAPAGVQLGLQIVFEGKPKVKTLMLGWQREIAVGFEWIPMAVMGIVDLRNWEYDIGEEIRGYGIYRESRFDLEYGDDTYMIVNCVPQILRYIQQSYRSAVSVGDLPDVGIGTLDLSDYCIARGSFNAGLTLRPEFRAAFVNTDTDVLKTPLISCELTPAPVRDFVEGVVDWDDINAYFESYKCPVVDKVGILQFLLASKSTVVDRNYEAHLDRYYYLHNVAHFLLQAKRLLNIVRDFVKEFESIAPFKLAQRVQDDWLHNVPNAETKRIVHFIGDSVSHHYQQFPLISSAAPFRREFIKSFSKDFNFTGLSVRKVDGMMARLVVQVDGNEVPLNRLGSGFKILMCIYGWLTGSASRYANRHVDGLWMEHDFRHDKINQKYGIALNANDIYPTDLFSHGGFPLSTIAIDELETNLHPSLQSKIATLLINLSLDHVKLQHDYLVPISDKARILDVPELTEEQLAANQRAQRSEQELAEQRLADLRARASALPYGHLHSRCLIFETHSEYIIRTALTLVAKGELTPDQVAINYFHAPGTQPPGEPPAYRIPIRSNGTLSREFGPGFFDEAQRLKLELIELNRVQANQAN